MLHGSRRAVSAAALGGASAVLGFGYASERPSREEDLPRRWDGAAIEAYWDARPFATLGRACAIARTVAPVLGGLAADYATAPRDDPRGSEEARPLEARRARGRRPPRPKIRTARGDIFPTPMKVHTLGLRPVDSRFDARVVRF